MGRLKRVVAAEEAEQQGQSQLFEAPPTGEEGLRTERMFEVSLSLSIKEEGGKADTINLLTTKARGTTVHQLLAMALASRRNTQIIAAVLDNPSADELAQAEAARKMNDMGITDERSGDTEALEPF